MRFLAVALVILAPALAAAAPLDGAGQLVVVRAASWNARQGTMRRYVRAEAGWVEEGKAVPVSLGGKGLAWGRGVAPVSPEDAPARGPAKKEGDARTPAGVFALGGATGAAPTPPPGTRLPYVQATEKLVCVDDGKSRAYNGIVEKTGGPGDDWSSSEPMLWPPIYDWTIFVEHNPGKVAGGGSCIFLHVSRKPGSTTLGCTALDRAALETLITWLDPARRPLLVVLPEAAYGTLKASWDLP